MPEYWFRYGVTEVSLEISSEVKHRKLEVKRGELSENLWRKIRAFAEDIKRDSGSGGVAVLYDHVGDDFSALMLKHLVESLLEDWNEEKITLLTSCWRLDRSTGLKHLKNILKKHGIRVRSIDAAETEKVDFHGMKIAREILESSARVMITTSEPHGLSGKASLKEMIALGGFVETELKDDFNAKIEEVWEDVSSRLPLYAVTTLNGETRFGEARKVEAEIADEDFSVPVEEFDAVITGSGGYPRDSVLQSVLHVLGLFRDAVVEDGLIGVIAECGGGLGSSRFLNMLLQKEEGGLDWELIKLAREVIEEKRVVFTTSLPRSILRDLLGIRGFDVPQEMLTYILRLYSKEARILILEEPKLRPVRTIKPDESSDNSFENSSRPADSRR